MDCGIQTTNINTQLQCIGGSYTSQPASEQILLNFSPRLFHCTPMPLDQHQSADTQQL